MKKQTAKAPAAGRWLRRGLLAGLLTAAGVLLWMQQDVGIRDMPVPTPSPAQTQKDERSARETAYDKDIAALRKLLESGTTDEHTRTQAARQLENLIAQHQSELAIEEALIQAGFRPLLVLCQNGAVTVMVEEALSTEAGATVLGICMAHAGVGAENIRIMTVER